MCSRLYRQLLQSSPASSLKPSSISVSTLSSHDAGTHHNHYTGPTLAPRLTAGILAVGLIPARQNSHYLPRLLHRTNGLLRLPIVRRGVGRALSASEPPCCSSMGGNLHARGRRGRAPPRSSKKAASLTRVSVPPRSRIALSPSDTYSARTCSAEEGYVETLAPLIAVTRVSARLLSLD